MYWSEPNVSMSDPFDLAEVAPPPPGAIAPAPYLVALNPEQRAAVEALDGPVLVLAGAGTGKTRVLTTRLAHLLNMRRAWPSQVLAVTFTNKAAREMRERVAALLGGTIDGLWLGTFHSTAARMLRRHAELVGLKPDFSILDQDDQIRLIKQVMEPEHLDDKRWPARMLAAAFDRWKDRGLTPDQVSRAEAEHVADGKGAELYAAYQARLLTLNACDFGDLLLHCLTLFRTDAQVLSQWQRKFRYVLVDEYQDANVAQYLWLRLLAQQHKNLCVVGDDDQSIYRWRGAEVGNILRFEQDFPGATVIRLERNYRSTARILGAASGLIAHNRSRLGKTLFPADSGTNDPGAPVEVRGVWDDEAEARMVGDDIEQLQRDGCPLKQMAILVRASFQTRSFEERLLTLGLPYRVIGGTRFYDRQEIRDAVSYLRVVHQPDHDLAFDRIVNMPRRGLGDSTMQTLHGLGRTQGISLTQAARRALETDELRPQARRALRDFMLQLDTWRAQLNAVDHVRLAEMVLDESGYVDMWRTDKSPEAPGKLENLKELVRALGEFENLAGFLEHVSLVSDVEQAAGEDGVNLMTLHGAKGLEFDAVFLPGWEEGLFPHQRSLDEGEAGLEEERRLAYVGLTRARRRAYLSHAANRRMRGSWQSSIPSRFIAELPDEHVERTADSGLYAGHGRGGGLAEPESVFAPPPPGSTWDTPGQRRARAFFAARNVTPPPPRENAPRLTSNTGIAVGDKVFHQKFGTGRVVARDADKLEIDFQHAGRKKVFDSFVTKA
jgi:DNA helicase II / ATP-dependent DNA helicase PcrA